MKKQDFITKLMEFTDTELNDFIKKNGKPPKKIDMCHIVVEKPNFVIK